MNWELLTVALMAGAANWAFRALPILARDTARPDAHWLHIVTNCKPTANPANPNYTVFFADHRLTSHATSKPTGTPKTPAEFGWMLHHRPPPATSPRAERSVSVLTSM